MGKQDLDYLTEVGVWLSNAQPLCQKSVDSIICGRGWCISPGYAFIGESLGTPLMLGKLIALIAGEHSALSPAVPFSPCTARPCMEHCLVVGKGLAQLTEVVSHASLEGRMLKLKLQYFGHLMQRTDSLKKTLMLRKTEGKRRRG